MAVSLCLKHTALDQAHPLLQPGLYVTCQWDRPVTLSPTPLLYPVQGPVAVGWIPGPHLC